MNRTTDISQAILSVSGIRKKFGPRTVLKSISLDLKPGDCTVLQGDNGVGKSTLLKILAGTLKPDEFDFIRINGEDSYNSPSYRKMIGSVNHQLMAYGDLDALDNLRFTAGLYGIKTNHQSIIELLDRFDLSARVHDPVRTYSRGMQQRLSICKALLIRPILFLMDEPYTGLDQKSRTMLNEVILEQKSLSKAILITSHEPETLKSLATNFIKLEKGILIQENS